MFGSIEAGGTKFVCGIGDANFNIIEKVSIPTTTPEETLELVFNFFDKYVENLQAIGIGSFGPIDVNPLSETYGHITSTPKLAWQHVDFLGRIKERYQVPTAWTTDVNAALYGEYHFGVAKNCQSAVYFTFGTGVGGAAIQNNKFIGGTSHPEMGHIYLRRHPEDSFDGSCPFHGDCLEGLAAGPAIEKRMGRKAHLIEPDNSFWDIEAYYLAQCAFNTTLYLAPEKIIFGGGVLKQEHLLPKVFKWFKKLSNGYVTIKSIEDYIVVAELEDKQATLGCFKLAHELLNEK